MSEFVSLNLLLLDDSALWNAVQIDSSFWRCWLTILFLYHDSLNKNPVGKMESICWQKSCFTSQLLILTQSNFTSSGMFSTTYYISSACKTFRNVSIFLKLYYIMKNSKIKYTHFFNSYKSVSGFERAF